MENTGWEDFKDDEISSEELGKRLTEVENFSKNVEVNNFTKMLEDYINEPNNDEGLRKIAFPELLEEMVQFANQIPVNRFGICPCCKSNWDGGDIYEELLKKGILSVSIGDAKKAAAMYGWTEFDKKHFSTLLTYELEGGIFVQCPNCTHVFNQDTSKEYKSLFDLKQELETGSIPAH